MPIQDMARLPGETLDQLHARLRSGRWNAISPRPASAMLTYDRWGHKRRTPVYRAQVSRWDAEKGKFEFGNCVDNHKSPVAAFECAQRQARKYNREDAAAGKVEGTPGGA